MAVQTDRFPAFITWLIFVAVVCHNEATAAQGPHDLAVGPAVEQQLSSFLLPIERALQGIQRRAAGDRALKQLANEPIVPVDYTNAKGEPKAYRRAFASPTDEQIEIATKGDAASIRFPGHVSVHIEVSREDPQEVTLGGLYNGSVTWRTNNPHVFVKLFWCSKDPGVPDRLLAIVREELEREGLRLLPMHKLDWPVATTSERLSQLLPPDSLPPVAPPPKTEGALPQSPTRVFASPYDVVAAHNRAVAKKDWQAYALCLTPASVGPGKPIECEGIRIEGDKASGYWIDRRPAPDFREAEKRDVLHYLPRYFPIRFRRIKDSWLIEW
ncbi:MAG: hypothetical protein P4L84_25635 [Isosphaeraceae bacterium]|nr:hypothetical protein [Isosphaeraceae bacterium]